MKQIFYIIVLLVLSSAATAQSSTARRDSSLISSRLNVGVTYKSNYFYMGRSDSSRAPYLSPSISYYHKSGISLTTSLAFLATGEQQRVDLFTLGAGYDYFGKKMAAGISVTQYFFDPASYSVQSEMNTYMNIYVGYDFSAFMLFTDVSAGLSTETDLFLGGEISRSFYLLRDKLRFTPAFYVNFGTQQYYNAYYTKRSISTGSGKEQGNGSGGHGQGGRGSNGSGAGSAVSGATRNGSIITITEIKTLESEKFQLLDYEMSLQASYKIGAFRFMTEATVLFPVNPSTVVTDRSTYEEDLNTGFLWSAGIRYTLK